jgi:hypothetical protein
MAAPAPQSAPAPVATASPQLLARIAAQLAQLAEGSEQFGLVLCSDSDVAQRYLVQLQQIDRLAQSLREVAVVLTSPDPQAAVAAIRLGDLRLALETSDAL